jgi:class 3 adenylate cyclase
MDFTAIGTPANLAARLEMSANPGMPCISQATYERVRDDFRFASEEPRPLRLKGFDDAPTYAWDVVSRISPRDA